MSDNNPFSSVDVNSVPPPRELKPKKGGQYRNPVSETPVTRAAAQKATGQTAGMHGNYKQANFKLKPEVLDQIDIWADRLNVNKSQLKRYLTWRGLRALEEGERPEYTQSAKEDLLDY
jgi:hypothetical protein